MVLSRSRLDAVLWTYDLKNCMLFTLVDGRHARAAALLGLRPLLARRSVTPFGPAVTHRKPWKLCKWERTCSTVRLARKRYPAMALA